jgi:hypothetical protein
MTHRLLHPMHLLLCGHRLAILLLAVAAGMPLAVAVELPNARLSTIWPPGCQQGEAVEVTLAGDDLDEATSLVFSHPGITAVAQTTPRPFAEQPEPFTTRYSVNVAADVPVGCYEVRVAGRFGLSTPRGFAVGDRPQTLESGDTKTADQAMLLPIDTVVNGRVDKEAVDHYRVTAAAGDRLVVSLQAHRLDSKLNGMLEVLDPEGRQIGFDRATHTHEPVVAFTAAVDGDYAVRLRDCLYRGGPEYFYRLSASRRPWVDFVWPPVVEAGKPATVTLFGYHLPAGQPADLPPGPGATAPAGFERLEQCQITLEAPADGMPFGLTTASHLREPNQVQVEGFEYRLPSAAGPANPVFIPLTRLPVVTEVEPNETPAAAQPIVPPCEVVGRFFGRRDNDFFVFSPEQGQRYTVEVISERLMLPTDPALTVWEAGADKAEDKQEPATPAAPAVVPGKECARQDEPDGRFHNQPFDVACHDPAVTFAAASDRPHLVRVWDLYAGSLAHPRHTYRLIIGPERPDFNLVATCKALVEYRAQRDVVFPTNPHLQRGGSQPILVQCYRRGGFDGPVELRAEGLPDGVSGPPVTLAAGEHQAVLVLTATDEAASWQGPIRLIGRAVGMPEPLEREAIFSTTVWNKNYRTEFVESRLVADLQLSVGMEAAAVTAAVSSEAVLAAAPGEKLAIPFVIDGRVELKGSATVEVRGLPATYAKWPSLPKVVLDKPAAKNRYEGSIELTLPKQMPPGRYPAHLVVQILCGYPRNPEAAVRAQQQLDDFAVTLANVAEELKQAEQTRDVARASLEELKNQAGDSAQAESLAAATRALEQAEQAVKQAATRREAAAKEEAFLKKRVADLSKAAEPRDVTAFISSPSFVVEVTAPPANEAGK